VKGNVAPETEYSEPANDAELTAIAVVVESFVSTTDLDEEFPMTTVPRSKDVVETVREVLAACPLPVSETVTLGLVVASLAITSEPFAVPVVPGANVTVKSSLFPAATVSGNVAPLTL
jgi:hypothetical protein